MVARDEAKVSTIAHSSLICSSALLELEGLSAMVVEIRVGWVGYQWQGGNDTAAAASMVVVSEYQTDKAGAERRRKINPKPR
jgi:hypothetical protein